ncbi:hypothetical protein M0R45_008862 [Rubus argutus]|uniref:Uncharacterized protein n=1 Tax=Rubus argutus TaxID=59490 RepID=A0AAW1Y3B0_RUBAR
MKDLCVELVKIQTRFTTTDLSNKIFKGEILRVIGELKVLKGLNFSSNKLTGSLCVGCHHSAATQLHPIPSLPSLTTELNHQPLNKPPCQPLSSSPEIHPQHTTAAITTVFSTQLRRSSLTHACTSMGTRRESPYAQTSSESVFAHPHRRSRRTAMVLLLIELHRKAKPLIITAFISHFKSQQSRRHHISPAPSATLPSPDQTHPIFNSTAAAGNPISLQSSQSRKTTIN